MALLLHIDTALEKAFVGLSRNGELLMELNNTVQYDHAAFVQPAIQQMINALHITLNAIDGVGITSGPGSYTGLRVGMASAKGICYALGKPLVAVSTLEVMAAAAVEAFPGFDVYAPMIDARRKEVYTALYNPQGEVVLPPHAATLSGDLFAQVPGYKKVLCFGSGAPKWEDMRLVNENTCFEKIDYNSTHLSQLLFNSFKNNNFCSLAYMEPLYVKDFYFEGSKRAK
ncbi:tRNA (adenosine(37)-N6)-threonylcarbamoyltransferase complex dimerization subunit type 1 TsaB [Agriterribacter sp.]|uniref:tRNA (adenosine(37)-N6)-threonylcarbamoyltransferase complex dimerization subunit type 1 TsaB n=1 Tax=Agriterribacter sp. TaxID=2821509 RepID=UPI002BE564B7|nr:tRNA (adenosine(37)-N6)-threonylcarbamoyltransferase complex dimerization subunit type 1 TsaB [Agriterribacter sp.]HRO45385.1 tRNA (adenosine(37)-N6)-threonylcarbamoyltransferase complex dimerization subunit type 1 TsaB [Agriterribacter sp.]HRQ16923.1 tRNA (adenosine(37)-N6)-threonylcarbamoyltransferase complex dimerization subunit type 1 TsaB [Agriterribacter sp.]